MLVPRNPTPSTDAGLASTTARGSAWMSAQALLNKLASAASMLAVASVLTRDEIGLGNLVLSISAFFVVLPPFVICDVLVTRRVARGPVYDGARRLALSVGVAFSIALVLVAPLIASIFPDFPRPTLIALLVVIAMRTTTNALMAPPLALLRSSLRYRTIAATDGAVQLAATAATLVLAFSGAGALSIVAPQLGGSACKAFLYWRAARDAGTAEATPEETVPVTGAFRVAALAQYAHSAAGALPLLAVGYLCDEQATGDYGFAFMLATQATVIIAFQLGTILQPVYSRMASDPERQALGYLRTLSTIGLVAVPLSLLQCALAEPLFHLLFSPKWDHALPVFQVLSIAQAFHFALAPTLAMLKARGAFSTILAWQFAQLAIGAFAFHLVAVPHGAIGVAVVDAALWGLGIPTVAAIAVNGSGVARARVLWAIVRPWLLAAPVAFAAWLAWRALPRANASCVVALALIGPLALGTALLLAARVSPDLAEILRRGSSAIRVRIDGLRRHG